MIPASIFYIVLSQIKDVVFLKPIGISYLMNFQEFPEAKVPTDLDWDWRLLINWLC